MGNPAPQSPSPPGPPPPFPWLVAAAGVCWIAAGGLILASVSFDAMPAVSAAVDPDAASGPTGVEAAVALVLAASAAVFVFAGVQCVNRKVRGTIEFAVAALVVALLNLGAGLVQFTLGHVRAGLLGVVGGVGLAVGGWLAARGRRRHRAWRAWCKAQREAEATRGLLRLGDDAGPRAGPPGA